MIESAYAAGQQEPSLIGFLLPIFILVLMYFILIRPQSKKIKEHKVDNTIIYEIYKKSK